MSCWVTHLFWPIPPSPSSLKSLVWPLWALQTRR
ncbi:hypothetical protein E2C01_088942 [Portunus trituberculatus]|uniref:Uncharacterized protein n=1 Tax=Portunus trituberculatus TaxID=210409 RepID=A0A5B7JAN6_PORTR|nr:hypothetical protein [Portunus trituberculatus]